MPWTREQMAQKAATELQAAERAVAQLDSLLADMKANPRRYVRLSIF